jgi:hypothetical protein
LNRGGIAAAIHPSRLAFQGGSVQVLRQSQCVKHSQYGVGFVTESNADRTTIEFDDHGVKKFVTSMMTVELLAGEAPPKSAKRRKKAATARATTR